MELDGLAAMEAALNAALQHAVKAGDKAMSDNAEDLLRRAIQLAPYEVGDLEGAGDVRPIGEGEYETGFYGLPYAVRQHEELGWHHPVKGEAKYLEKPFAENQDKYLEHVAAEVKSAL